MRSRRSARVEIARDLGEALTGGVLSADALDELGRQDGGASGRAGGAPAFAWWSAAFGEESFELVDGDDLRAPGQLDQLDVRQQAVEGGAADAERLGCLAAGVGEALHLGRRAHAHRGLRVATFLLGSTALTA